MEDKSILGLVADNPLLMEALRKLITEKFEVQSMLNGAVTVDNQRLGEIVRARLEGLAKVEDAFREISTFQSVLSPIQRVNRAR